MTSHPTTTIALADSRWFGHHPTFYKEFTASLLRVGTRVIALNRNPEEFRESALQQTREMGRDLDEWIAIQYLDDPEHAFLSKSRDHDTISVLQRWKCLRRALDKAESDSGWKADMVFFPMLDPYIRFMPTAKTSDRFLRRPWSGLYFRNFHLSESGTGPLEKLKSWAKGDHAMRNSWCRSIAVLDERFMPELESKTDTPVFQFPDITDETRPAQKSELSAQILRQANGRPIIGLISMEKRKGVLTLLKAALSVKDRKDWFFMFAGPFASSTFTADELEWIHEVSAAIQRGEHDHIYLKLDGERIEDGEPFNALIEATDIVYAAYEDFQGSSNALTKAAIFEKHVIATRGECVGARVEQFGLGLCIDQGDVEQCVLAIGNILERKDESGCALTSGFAAYREFHSRSTLDRAFRRTIEYALPGWDAERARGMHEESAVAPLAEAVASV